MKFSRKLRVYLLTAVGRNNNNGGSVADRHIPRKPRVKGDNGTHDFWCFFHKRFFGERKKLEHCIPKGCFEFNRRDYLLRTSVRSAKKVKVKKSGDCPHHKRRI